jgi:hypothetical protein
MNNSENPNVGSSTERRQAIRDTERLIIARREAQCSEANQNLRKKLELRGYAGHRIYEGRQCLFNSPSSASRMERTGNEQCFWIPEERAEYTAPYKGQVSFPLPEVLEKKFERARKFLRTLPHTTPCTEWYNCGFKCVTVTVYGYIISEVLMVLDAITRNVLVRIPEPNWDDNSDVEVGDGDCPSTPPDLRGGHFFVVRDDSAPDVLYLHQRGDANNLTPYHVESGVKVEGWVHKHW